MGIRDDIIKLIRASPNLILWEECTENVAKAVLDVPSKGIAVITIFPSAISLQNAKARMYKHLSYDDERIKDYLNPLLEQ